MKEIPQAIDVEKIIIGAILIEPESIHLISDSVKPEMFYNEQHKLIYQACYDMSLNDMKIDIITVSDYLRKKDLLDQIGGASYITKLTMNVGGNTHLEYHSKIIIQKWGQRELIKEGITLKDKCFSDEDISDVIDSHYSEIEKVSTALNADAIGEMINEIVNKSIAEAEERVVKVNKGESLGVKTPLFDLTKLFHGWQKGEYYILAARPSMGKTAFALEIARKAAEQHSVLFFSLEMSKVKLSDRLILGFSGVDSFRYNEGTITSDDFEKLEDAREYFSKLNLVINDKSGLTIDEIKAISRVEKRKRGCDMIIIDYLGLVRANSENKSYNRVNEVGEISRKVKGIAKDLDVPVIVLSQLNRKCEDRADKKPHLSDLRDTGDIEQDADSVMLLFRPARYPDVYVDFGENGEDKNKGFLSVEKNRNGQIGEIKFKHNETLTRFYDIDNDIEEPF